MAKVDLKALLKKANKLRGEAQTKRKEMKDDKYDDGRYNMRCVAAEISTSQAGKLMAVLTWKFLEGEYKGKTKKDFRVLENADQFSWLEDMLAKMGFDPDAIEDYATDLPALMKEIGKEKPICKVSLKTNGDFVNLRVLRLLDESDVEDSEDDAEEETEEADEEEAEEEDEEEEEQPKKKGKAKKDDDEEEEEEEAEEEESEDEEEEEESEEEEEEEASDDDEVALSIGSSVKVKTKDGVVKAEVTDIDEKKNEVVVKTKDGKKLRLKAEKIVEVLDTPQEAPAKKKAKKK